MKQQNTIKEKGKFGTVAVFMTSISAILGAILFLRLGVATGTLGLFGALIIIAVGHLITIPTALAVSELATNTRVEGGGVYFIISRSFGLKIGATIGFALFLSQTISVAFYIVAFTEAFHFLFDWFQSDLGINLPKQAISIPTLLILAYVILRKGSSSGMKLMYIVNFILFIVLILFFLGKPVETASIIPFSASDNIGFFNKDQFFILFAICFPAFTGMTAGVGLSGDLRNPGKAIPMGTMLGTIAGLVIYVLVVWKLSISASQADLQSDQMIMSRIALYGVAAIPIGLAACAFSSAIGQIMVAPRTLQAIAADKTFPFRKINLFLARGKGATREPINSSVVTFIIALFFVAIGDVNTIAGIISMFFLITYGALCLISFLNHFGSPPSYRPRFKSRWYLSFGGFLLSVWVMFMISPMYTIISGIVIVLIYLFIEHYNKDRKGLVNIFKGALFQLNRQLQVYMQKRQSSIDTEEWRPAAICVSPHSFEREKVLELMKWISHQHGFGTYFHLIEGYYSKQTYQESKEALAQLLANTKDFGRTLYVDTMISPSYTSAIAQVIQTPSISGMENNLVIFEYDKRYPDELSRILDNVNLVRAGNFDVGIFAISEHFTRLTNGIHVWIREHDEKNTNFMILLGYIIMSHPDWKKSHIKIFLTSTKGDLAEVKSRLEERIATGRLPITLSNIEIVIMSGNQSFAETVETHSAKAALTIIGFHEELIKYDAGSLTNFNAMGDILFVNSAQPKEII